MNRFIEGGYYLKARKLRNSDIAKKPPCYREIWDWLIEQANHSTNGAFPRGSCMRSIKDMQEGLCWYVGYRKEKYTKSQCESALKWLRNAAMITTTKTTRGMFITIDNYKEYQNPKNYEHNSEDNNESNKKTTTPPHYKQECKKVKNDKNKPTTNQKQKIDFNFDKEVWQNIKDKDIISWNEAYPACDVKLEITQMKEWLLSNPSKRKANYRRFITNWLSRSQEKGGSKKGDKKPDERKVFNQALESLNIYYSKNKLAAWLNKLPEKYHKEFQKYPDFEEVEEKWKKKELQSNY